MFRSWNHGSTVSIRNLSKLDSSIITKERFSILHFSFISIDQLPLFAKIFKHSKLDRDRMFVRHFYKIPHFPNFHRKNFKKLYFEIQFPSLSSKSFFDYFYINRTRENFVSTLNRGIEIIMQDSNV